MEFHDERVKQRKQHEWYMANRHDTSSSSSSSVATAAVASSRLDDDSSEYARQQMVYAEDERAYHTAVHVAHDPLSMCYHHLAVVPSLPSPTTPASWITSRYITPVLAILATNDPLSCSGTGDALLSSSSPSWISDAAALLLYLRHNAFAPRHDHDEDDPMGPSAMRWHRYASLRGHATIQHAYGNQIWAQHADQTVFGDPLARLQDDYAAGAVATINVDVAATDDTIAAAINTGGAYAHHTTDAAAAAVAVKNHSRVRHSRSVIQWLIIAYMAVRQPYGRIRDYSERIPSLGIPVMYSPEMTTSPHSSWTIPWEAAIMSPHGITVDPWQHAILQRIPPIRYDPRLYLSPLVQSSFDDAQLQWIVKRRQMCIDEDVETYDRITS